MLIAEAPGQAPVATAYEVRLEAFSGPLDLLLRLIERRELDITLVSLAAVTDQYLRYVESMIEPDPDELADFLVVAAKLLAIKALALVAPPVVCDESEETEGEELVRALRDYQQFKQAAARLRAREVAGHRCYPREVPVAPIRQSGAADAVLEDLVGALRRLLMIAQPPPPPPAPEPPSFTVKEQIAKIEAALAVASEISFRALLPPLAPLVQVVVTFLAVLELIKAKRVRVAQNSTFGEIMLAPIGPASFSAPSLKQY